MIDKFVIRLVAYFALITAALFVLKPQLLSQNAHFYVLVGGNVFMAAITALSYHLNKKGLKAKNNNTFVQMVYLSTFSKLFLCLIAIVAYVLLTRDNISKISIFILLGFYLVYTVVETISIYGNTGKNNS
ncbi:hypothetical protein LX64_04568 [Chitinophaga skermanii]|uniref:Uncharacterized protein n=1 Tax=Chitinophaga skermanii TaxID=331697 RepID=A0A327Q633_9BACT|nr:hypothetical protein [Chitinophaga skermanii]RAI99434.1 hypothetical protein LX64_04568 [Chitinophaga skermanii]